MLEILRLFSIVVPHVFAVIKSCKWLSFVQRNSRIKSGLSCHFVPATSTYYSSLHLGATSTRELCCTAPFRVKISRNSSETRLQPRNPLNVLPSSSLSLPTSFSLFVPWLSFPLLALLFPLRETRQNTWRRRTPARRSSKKQGKKKKKDACLGE